MNRRNILKFVSIIAVTIIKTSAYAKPNFQIKARMGLPGKIEASAFELPNRDIIAGFSAIQHSVQNGNTKYYYNGPISVYDKNLKIKTSLDIINALGGFTMWNKETAVTVTLDGVLVFYNYLTSKFSTESIGEGVARGETPAVLSDGTIAIGTDKGIALYRGGKISKVPVDNGAFCLLPTVVSDHKFVVTCDNGTLNYFNGNGDLIHKYQAGSWWKEKGQFGYPLLLPNGNIAVAAHDGHFYIFSPNGDLISKSGENYAPFRGRPVMYDRSTIVARASNSTNSSIIFFDADTGLQKNKYPAKYSDKSNHYFSLTLVTTDENEKLIAVSGGSQLFFLNDKAELVSTVSFPKLFTSEPVQISTGDILVSDDSNTLTVLSQSLRKTAEPSPETTEEVPVLTSEERNSRID